MVALTLPVPRKNFAADIKLPSSVFLDKPIEIPENNFFEKGKLSNFAKELANPKNTFRNKFISSANIIALSTDILGGIFPKFKKLGEIAYRSFMTINGLSNGLYDLNRNQIMAAIGNFTEIPVAWMVKKIKNMYNLRPGPFIYNLFYALERAMQIPRKGFNSTSEYFKLNIKEFLNLTKDLISKPVETLKNTKRATLGVLGSLCSGIGTMLCLMGYERTGNFFRSILSLGVEVDRGSIDTFLLGMNNRALATCAFTMGNIANFFAMPTLQIAFDGIGRMAAGKSNDLNEISSDYKNKVLPLPWKKPLAFLKEMFLTLVDLLLGRSTKKVDKAIELTEEYNGESTSVMAGTSKDSPLVKKEAPPFYSPFVYMASKIYTESFKKEEATTANADDYDDSQGIDLSKYPLHVMKLDDDSAKKESKHTMHIRSKSSNKSHKSIKKIIQDEVLTKEERSLTKDQLPKLEKIILPTEEPVLAKEEQSLKFADIDTLKVIYLPKKAKVYEKEKIVSKVEATVEKRVNCNTEPESKPRIQVTCNSQSEREAHVSKNNTSEIKEAHINLNRSIEKVKSPEAHVSNSLGEKTKDKNCEKSIKE